MKKEKKNVLSCFKKTLVFSFACMNPYSDWKYCCKVINILSFSEEAFAPLTIDQIYSVMNLFRGSELMITSLDNLYLYVYGRKKEHWKTRWSNLILLKSILLRFFPLLVIDYQDEVYILDVVKCRKNVKAAFAIFGELLEDDQTLMLIIWLKLKIQRCLKPKKIWIL